MGDWTADSPGVRRLITVDDLPLPNATPSSDKGPRMVPRPAGALPKAPAGFEVDLLAEGLTHPRKIVTAPKSIAQAPSPSKCEEMRANSQQITRMYWHRSGSCLSMPISFSTASA